MKSQISISGQAVSRRRAANQVKPFHRQKTDSHTRRPGIVSGRYDDPVTVKRLGKTDPLAHCRQGVNFQLPLTMVAATSDWETPEPRSGLSQVGRPGAIQPLRSKPTNRPDSCRGDSRNYVVGGPSDVRKRWSASFNLSVPDPAPPVPSSQNSCQVAFVTLEVTAKGRRERSSSHGVP
jgi:hypothetical protein